MPIDKDDIDSSEKAVYQFLKQRRGSAYTKEELRNEVGVDEVGGMYDYTTFRPLRWKRSKHDGSNYYFLEWNVFALVVYSLIGGVIVFMAYLAVYYPEAYTTTCL